MPSRTADPPCWFCYFCRWLCCNVGAGISYELREWLLQYLSAFDRVLDKRLNTHRVRNKVAGMENAYRFAELGCVVAKGE